MKYYLVDYVPSGRNSRPALPDGTGFLLLAAPGFDPGWGVFAVDGEVPPSDQVRPVAAELRSSLQAAEQYPPAIALARDTLSNEFDGEPPTDEVFCIRYTACWKSTWPNRAWHRTCSPRRSAMSRAISREGNSTGYSDTCVARRPLLGSHQTISSTTIRYPTSICRQINLTHFCFRFRPPSNDCCSCRAIFGPLAPILLARS